MSRTRTLQVWCVLILALLPLALAEPSAAQGGEGEVVNVYRLGRPATTFSAHSANTLEELKDLFDRYEADLRKALEAGQWPGDPQDLFTVVRSAREGGDTVTERSVASGERLQWMAYRKRGEPTVARNVRWAAKEPFEAWNIEVLSRGMNYVFVVPKTCMNLALEKATPAPPPSCSLSASFDPEADQMTITGSTDGEGIEIVGLRGPDGADHSADISSAGAGSWTFRPQTDGRYEVRAQATGKGGQTSTCSASAEVKRKRPVCSLNATVAPDTKVVELDATGSVGEFTMTGITLPDGVTGNLDDAQSAGAMRWSYDAEPTLPKKPGDYVYTFSATTSLHGFEESCEATALITREGRQGRWNLRGFAAFTDPAGDRAHTDTVRPNGVAERTALSLSSGTGFGLGLEYMANPRLGIEGAVSIASFDADLMVDLDDAWETARDDVEFNMLSLGANYHLTPDKRVDFWLGALVGLVQFDDNDFRALGETWPREFDDETAFGLSAGLDVPFSWQSPWAFTTGLRYLWLDGNENNTDVNLKLDPLIVSAGIAYRF